MLTKGFIKEKLNSTNKYIVRIPIFEKAGTSNNLDSNDSLFEATLCYSPGNYDGYNPGDCVFIDFEDDDFAKPVILGKLYKGTNQECGGYNNIDSLTVTNSVRLPENTKIKDITLSEFLTSFKHEQNLEERLAYLELELYNLLKSI